MGASLENQTFTIGLILFEDFSTVGNLIKSWRGQLVKFKWETGDQLKLEDLNI